MVTFIVKVSLAERAYAAILDRILRGRVALGEPLSRRILAAELGMSLIPEQLFCLIAKNQVLVRNWLYDVAARRRALPPTFHRDLSGVLTGNDVLAADAMIRRHVKYGLEETLQKITMRTAGDWRLSRSTAAVS